MIPRVAAVIFAVAIAVVEIAFLRAAATAPAIAAADISPVP